MNLVDYELKQQAQAGYKQTDSVMPLNNDTNNSASPRQGEKNVPITFRTNRFFSIATNWYFSTREGIDQGPFISKERAEHALAKLISEKQS